MPGGALEAIAAGALKGVSRIFALHCDPHLAVGSVATAAGPITSAADFVEIALRSPGGHTSRPHLTTDLVYGMGTLITGLPGVLSRRLDPRHSTVMVWGAAHAGSAPNAIPQTGTLAGTVRTASDARDAADAGARFVVSPGYTSAVGRACADRHLPLLPGVATGSEIMAAHDDGLQQMKFFPALQAGGAAMLKAWHGPFGEVLFCPTGGISTANAAEFLALPNVACVGGSWLTPADALAAGDWQRITAVARDAAGLRKRK
jgi:2-dehydro-3-deoxyphosphogluconate aldolase/(4S)-4-hydroxy-2-oxoglutarate aldolase